MIIRIEEFVFVLHLLLNPYYVVCVPQSFSRVKNTDCFIVKGTTLKLEDTHVDKYLSVSSLAECKKECILTFINCKSFSYKKDISDENQLDANCLLSREDSTTINTRDSRDFDYDDQFTFYERSTGGSSDCDEGENHHQQESALVSSPVYPRNKEFNKELSNCFRFIATGRRAVNRLVDRKFKTSNKAACEEECLRATTFTCRGFNYRYITLASSVNLENCELTSQDSFGADLEDTYAFSRDIDFDFFERTNFGKKCDGNNFGHRRGDTAGLSTVSRFGTDDPFYGTDRYDSRNRYNSHDRYGARYPGDPFYYTGSRPSYGGRDRYRDYPHYGSYGRNRRDCFRLFEKETRLDSRVIRDKRQVRDLNECKEECRISRNFVCRTIAFSFETYSTSWFGKDNCYLSDLRSITLDQYDLIYDRYFDVYSKDDYGRLCDGSSIIGGTIGGTIGGAIGGAIGGGVYYNNRPHHHHNSYFPYGREDHFETVSGLPCYRGGCREDHLGRYFFCETDLNGGWDYCCRPNEYCDRSSGYPLSWCYVGVFGNDQWRPCSTNTIPFRSYLKKDVPDSSLLLEDPSQNNQTARLQVDTESPIDVADITDLG